MTFHIPKMQDFFTSIANLKANYEERRKVKDLNRFFGSYRAPTINISRLNDIEFIQNVAKSIKENKNYYDRMDPVFSKTDYSKTTAPFLRRVLSGALIFNLIKITQTYSSEKKVKDYSALAEVILNVFGIDKLSDLPTDFQKECLEDLKRYMVITNLHLKKESKELISWHPEKTIKQIKMKINEIISQLPKEEADAQLALAS